MLINKDPERAHGIHIKFAAGQQQSRYFAGKVDRITFGANEYQWHANGQNGKADPDGPQMKSVVNGGRDAVYSLPKASITVLRGQLAAGE